MPTIPLSGEIAAGRVALVDDEDFTVVSARRWHVQEFVRSSGQLIGPYAVTTTYRNGRKTKMLMHKLITGWEYTDHANNNGLDNRRVNLRPATHAQNNHNQRPRRATSSEYKGVTWHRKIRKWQATIKVDGKCHYLGVFVVEADAAHAYNAAALEAYGSYAYLNPLPGEGLTT
jgi:hypothetical protein